MAKQTEEKLILTIEVEDDNAVESIDSIRKSTRQLTQERNALNLATEEGRKRAQELNRTIDENNKRIKENSSALEKQRLNVGNYTDSIKDAANQLEVAGVNVGGLTEKLSAGINPLAAAAAGVSALAGLYLSSAAGARDLQSAQSQLSTSFKVISNDLAELVGADGKGGGLLSSLAFELNKAVFGLSAAVTGSVASRAELAIQELEVAELNAQQFAKNQLSLSEQQRRIRDDESKSLQERLAGAQSVEQFINAREAELVAIQEKKLQQLRILLSLDKNNLELQKQVKQVEFEISDIREDSEGKRTEALNGVIAIQKLIRQQAIDDNAAITDSTAEATTKQGEVKDEAFLKDLERINARTKAEQDAANFVVDVTNLEIDEVEAARDAQAKAEAERVSKEIEDKKKLAAAEAEKEKQKAAAFAQSAGAIASIVKRNSIAFKATASAQAVVNTFLGVSEILSQKSTLPSPFDFITKAINAAATIASGLNAVKQINGVTFAKGGIARRGGVLNGPSHSDGGIKFSVGGQLGFEAEGGEAIINKKSTALFKPLLSKINQAGGGVRFANGGLTGVTETRNAFSSVQSDRAQSDLRNSLSNLQPVLVLQDFELTQNTRNRIQTTAQVI